LGDSIQKFDWDRFDNARVQRRAEILAVWFLQQYFADQHGIKVVDQGEGGATDFIITKCGSHVGLGEVKGDFSPVIQKQRSDFLKHRSSWLPLEPGLGVWSATLLPTANIKKLTELLPDLIRDLSAAGGTFIETSATWHYGLDSFTDRAHSLGIDSLSGANGSGDFVHFITDRFSGFVPENGALVASWLGAVLSKHAHKASIAKISKSELPQRHVFIWLADNSPDPIRLSAAFHPEKVPQDDPGLPPWVTHLWIGIPRSFTESQYLWLFRPETGWSAVKCDGLYRPGKETLFRAFARKSCKLARSISRIKCFSRERTKNT
jgi:hypothetical protein